MSQELTLGILFDGIGGFPLAAIHCGVKPIWANEIEAFPIEVTKKRFPGILHVGDITKLDGAKLPPADIICGGSPCQDLSVAGARAGIPKPSSPEGIGNLWTYLPTRALQVPEQTNEPNSSE